MATYWVADNGDDGQNGSSYTLAKATLSAGVGLLAQGDTLNVVGSFDMLSAVVAVDGASLRGTSYSDPACIIRGTDSAGEAAQCTVTANSTTLVHWLQLTNRPNYAIIRGFHIDTTAKTNAAVNFCVTGGTGQFPARVEYCTLKGNDTNAVAYTPRLVWANAAYNVSQEVDPAKIDVRYCYFPFGKVEGDNSFLVSVDHCVFHWDHAINYSSHASLVDQDTNSVNRGPAAYMTNCTVDMRLTGLAPRPGPVLEDYSNAAGGWSERQAHSNLIVLASSVLPDDTQLFLGGMFANGAAPSADVYDGVVGYNWLVFDTNFTSAIDTSANAIFYDNYYNPDYPTTVNGTAVYTTDLRVDSTTISEIINGTAAWVWTDINSSGYDIDLPKDYRLNNTTATTAAYDDGPIGAIEDPVYYPPDPDTDDPSDSSVVDTAPFFRPTLEVTTEFRIKTKKNRRLHHDLANYTERVLWDESTHRVLNLGTNTTTELTLGGVASAEYLIIETDNDVKVSVNDSSRYWPVSSVVSVALSGITTIHLQNNSAINTAQVIVAVSD